MQQLCTVLHSTWLKFPRLCLWDESHVLVTWPCGKAEHPLHVEHVLSDTWYKPWRDELRAVASPALREKLSLALHMTDEEGITLLLPHREEVKAICDAAPTGLFRF